MRSAREETISTELRLTFRNLNCEIVKLKCQSSTGFKFEKPRYQRRKPIKILTVKIFIERAQGGRGDTLR